MLKNLIVSLVLLLSLSAAAQQGTSSPYSFYGIGDVRFKGNVENRFQGGVSIVQDSTHINLQNPAGYGSLRLTTFAVAGTFSASRLETANAQDKAQRTALDYFAVAFPVSKKFGFGFGLLPYSSVGYKIRSINPVNGFLRKAEGQGGLNRVFLGGGYSPTKSFSIGANVNYNFGQIKTRSSESNNDVAQLGAQEETVSSLKGFTADFGAMYNKRFREKYRFYGAARYSVGSNIKSNNTQGISTIADSDQFLPYVFDRLPTVQSTSTIKLPSSFSFGGGFGKDKVWFAGAEYTLKSSDQTGNRFNNYTNVSFEKGNQLSLGGYYTPDFNSFSNYFKKITYRGGFRVERTGLIVSDESIKEQALTFGLSLPIGSAFSQINVGGELGKRGTRKALLVQENFFNVVIGISFNDRWFVKRKYD